MNCPKCSDRGEYYVALAYPPEKDASLPIPEDGNLAEKLDPSYSPSFLRQLRTCDCTAGEELWRRRVLS